MSSPVVVAELGEELRKLGWVTDLMVAGSLATGDYVDGVSDLDLVALVDGPVDEQRQAVLVEIHRRLDAGSGAGRQLGCVYVAAIEPADARHPTWTHGLLVHRILSGITRAELVRHGYAVFGRPPPGVFPDVDVRAAAHAEVTGYWAWAAARPWIWLDPIIADLGLTSMARGRHALATGELLTKSEAIQRAYAPAWLIGQLAARRQGRTVPSPRIRTAWIAWRDALRTVSRARRAYQQDR